MTALITPRLHAPYDVAARGQGVHVWDDRGRRYLDGSSGAVCVNVGHGEPRVLEALRRQAGELDYVLRLHFANAPAQRLAARIARDWAPPGLGNVWFSSSGSDAVEFALRTVRQYHVERGEPARQKIISTWHSYHGSTFGALAASGREHPRALHQPYFSGAWTHVRAPYAYRCPFACGECTGRCADDLEQAVVHEGPGNVAAILLEPINGTTAGAYTGGKPYLGRAREVCDRYGLLLVADEVMTGFGRTGAAFAVDHFDCRPDLIACGKGLGAGYVPLFATLVGDHVMAAIAAGSGRVGLGNTYCAHPLSCAVGEAVLDVLEDDGLVEAARVRGQRVGAALTDLAARHAIVGDVRGRGLLWAVELVRDRATREPFAPGLRVAERIGQAARRNGLILFTVSGTVDGVRGDHVMVAPPLCIAEDDLDDLLARLGAAVAETEAALASEGGGHG